MRFLYSCVPSIIKNYVRCQALHKKQKTGIVEAEPEVTHYAGQPLCP